jgi:Fe-S cluster assembly protein SufD
MSGEIDHFRKAFSTLEKERSDDAFTQTRRTALERFAALGLPTTKQEDFRFTNLAPLRKSRLPLARPTANGVARSDVERLALGKGLVFLDGHYRPDLSDAPAGVEVKSLAAALEHEQVRAHLGRLADGQQDALVALNEAFLEDGAFVRVPRGQQVSDPIHLLFLGTDKVCFPRHLFLVEESAEARVVETYVSLGEEPHWTHAVCEAVVGSNAKLGHYRLQCENERAYHVYSGHVHQERDSRYTSHVMTLGGALTRNDITAALDGEGALCTLNGLFFAHGVQHVDNHTRIEHRKPHAESHELYKGILDGRASGVFTGYIHVFPDAQKTDAYQSSASLLLSDEALMDSKPQLEIYADDVKCSHGSTIGQLDEDALFYMRARGIPRAQAHTMLIRAFAHDVIDRMHVDSACERVDALLAERLPKDAASRA